MADWQLPPQILGPFWAALASDEARLPTRLTAALLTLVPSTVERAARAEDASRQR